MECAVVYVRRVALVRYGLNEPAEEPDWLPLLAQNRAGGGKWRLHPFGVSSPPSDPELKWGGGLAVGPFGGREGEVTPA